MKKKETPQSGGHSHSSGGHPHSSGGHSHSSGGHSHGHNSPGHGVAVEDGFVAAPRPPGSERVELDKGAGKGKVLFFDMPSGIAGDMTISALLDLGVPFSVLQEAVSALGLDGIELSLESGYAGAIGCCHFDVRWPQQEGERSYREIVKLIEASNLEVEVKELSLRIFARLAEAESSVHRTTLDQVHFHEVGAVDAIVDIVGASALICYLGAEICSSPVPLGRGFVQCRHGSLPLPAPAALNCLAGVPTISSGLEAELVTPTGAAIIATVAGSFMDWPSICPQRVGWGAGTRGLPDRPNALRLILGEKVGSSTALTHALLEANIDDMSGELAGYALSQTMLCGALDAWIVPATMKKGRPGLVFSALCEVKDVPAVTASILGETTTIGVRQSMVSRHELPRETLEIETQWGSVRLKKSGNSKGSLKLKPEYSDCARIAEREKLPLRDILSEVLRLAHEVRTLS